MFEFIQSLEPRTLLSGTPVTQATLAADEALIVADATAAKAGLKTLSAIAKSDTKPIQTDLKGLPKSNAPLLKKLKVDEAKLLALITKDVNALFNPGKALSKRSTAEGESLLKKPTAKLAAKVAVDAMALGSITAAPLARFEADSQGTAIIADLQSLADANPGSMAIMADTSKTLTDLSTQNTALTADATKFQTDIEALGTDLGSAASNSSTIPTITGIYSGSSKETGGSHIGGVTGLVFEFDHESPSGVLTGTATLTRNGQFIVLTLNGTVTDIGGFSATLTDTTGQGNDTTVAGTVVGSTISGTYESVAGTSQGTFTTHK